MGAFSFGFGDPGIGGVTAGPGGAWSPTWGSSNPTPPPGGGGPSNPSGSWLSQLLPWAGLGAQTFLADQAITSPRPSTVQFAPNGQVVGVAGGGASLPLLGSGQSSLTSILGTSSVLVIGFVVLLFILLLKK